MIQQEKKLFVGGLNSDDEDRFLADGDYRYALNIRNSKTDKSSIGAIENTRGNTEIIFTLPTGLNKCIGSKYDSTNNRIVFFIWNALSSHCIYELNIGTQVVTLLLQSSVFNFDRNYPILHCDIIDDLCYWTDEFNPPRKINIARAKSGGYTTIDEQSITAIQYAPRFSPITVFGSNGQVNYNKVRNKVFQFKYSFVYDDNEISAFSPVSKVAIPPNQSIYDYGGYYEVTLDNHIRITVTTGNYLCKRIQIICREGNTGDWNLVKELDKAELNINDDDQYIYSFYNDEVFIPITQAKANLLFDNVPLLAGGQSMIDGNRLVYSDVTDGFDNIVIDVQAEPIYNIYPAIIQSKVGTTGSPYGLSTVDDSTILGILDGIHQRVENQVILINANSVSDTHVWNVACLVELFATNVTPAPTITTWSSDFVNSFSTGTTSQIIADYFKDAINNSGSIGGVNSGSYPKINVVNISPVINAGLRTVATTTNMGGGIYSLNIKYIIDIGYDTSITITNNSSNTAVRFRSFADLNSNFITKTFKHNSRHSLALVYYDAPDRSGVCQVSDALDVKTLAQFQLANHGSIEMDLTINHLAPDWATHYQILYTGNRSVSTYLQIDTGSVITTGSQMKIYINTIGVYNTQSGGKANLSYSWTKGDRVTFISYGTNIFFTEYYDLEIISSTSDGGGQYIIVDNVLPVSLTNGTLIELYTPKLNQEQVFYWEIGEVLGIVNRFHAGTTQSQTATQPAIIRVNSGDSYFRYRGNNTDSFIEDYSLSDYYVSNSWDRGRFNVVDKDFKRIRRYATSFYSESFIPDTNINGLSTIYDTNFHEANKSYGAIQKTYAEQDRIYFFQQLRTGFSLVNKDVLYSSDGTPNGVVGQANQILSDVNYYIQDYGIGDNPESFVVDSTRKYHVDANKGYVLRLSIDGYTPISDYKYRNFFQNLFNRRKEIPVAYLGKIWGGFDRRFEEYVLAFEPCKTLDQISFRKDESEIISGEILIPADTISFSEEKKRWITHYSWKPEFIQLNGIDLVTWTNGKMYLHNSNNIYNNFYGVQYNSIVELVSNQDPSNIKFYTSVYEESTDTWGMVATNQFGQQTSLETTDFELNEGVYYAALLKDSNTPNLTYPLIEGDDMRCHSMTMVFTNTNTGFVKMFAVTVRFGYSEMTNK